MERTELTNRILFCLGILEGEIDVQLRNGRTDIMHNAERICCGLLNHVYDYQLLAVNRIRDNYASVDLADSAQSVAVQVTTVRTSRKMQQTIDNFRKSGLHTEFKTLIILILSTAPKPKFRLNDENASFDVVIMNLADIADAVRNLTDVKKLRKIVDDLTQELGYADLTPITDFKPAHPLPAVPAPAASFVTGSRDWEIKEIQLRLQHSKMLFLCGAAGIGKTQLALQYAATHAPQKGAYFLQYQPSADPEPDPIRQILLQAEFRNYTFTGMDNDRHDKDYAQRLSILREEYSGALLIIDGLDLPDDAALESRDSLNDLLHTGVKLLFTSRRRYDHTTVTVGPLKAEDSLTLLKYHGADKAFPSNLLSVAAAAMGHCPLYVDQIARLMGQSPVRITQKQLRLLANVGSPAAAVRRIQTMLCGSVGSLSADHRSVLFLASLMPECGLTENLFRYALDNAQKQALTSLLQDNWLLKTNKYLSVHPYIRQACRDAVTPPTAEYCRDFVDRLWYYEQSFRWDRHSIQERKHTEQALAQTFAAAAECFPKLALVCSRRSARLLQKTNQIRAALQWELKTLPFLKRTDPWAYARACHFVGTCYFLLGEHGQALGYWNKTLHLCEETLAVSAPDLAAAHYHAGCAHLALERYQEAAKQLERARILHNETLSKTHPFREAVLQKMDIVYAAMGQHKTALDYLYSDLAREPEARYLWLPIPSGVGLPSFFGREAELRQILSMLQHNEKPIIITGLQGSGKTELVLQFSRNYQRGRVYFARFDTTLTRTVAGMARSIRPALSQAELNQSDDVLCRMVMDVLRNCSAYDILIIDDVASVAASRREPIYRELMELDCRLIVTAVSAPYKSIRVQPLPYEALFDIFRKHGAQLEESEMRALIDAVNGHTLTIDLIAHMLGGGEKTVTAAQLLDAFSHDLPDGAGMHKPSAGGGSAGQPLYEKLSAIFRLAQLSPSARDILRYVVLIPEQGIDAKLFYTATPAAHRDHLKSLTELSWLSVKDGVVTVQPVVQLVCRQELNPTDESCGAFLDALWAQYSPARYDAAQYRQMAEVFSRAARLLEDRQAEYILRADTLWHALGEYQRSREMLDDALPRYEHILPQDSPKLARLYNNAGRTYIELGMLANALEYTLRALTICEKIYPPDHPELAASYRNVGSTYSSMGNYDIALKYLQKALWIQKNNGVSDDPELSAVYDSIGNIYNALGNQQEALEYQLKALTLLEKTLPPDHPDLASSYHNVGAAYSALGDHRKALEYQYKALDICLKVLPSTHPALADAYQGAGNCCILLGDYQRALEYLENSLEIYQKSLPAGHPKLAAIRDRIASLEVPEAPERPELIISV